MKAKQDEASEKLVELQDSTGDAWENLKAGAETLWDDLKMTLNNTKDAFFEDTSKTG